MNCKHCDSTNYYAKPSGRKIGLYCANCNTWISWISNRRTSMITRFWGIKHKLIEENRAKKNGGMWRPVKIAPTQADEGHLQFPLKTFVE